METAARGRPRIQESADDIVAGVLVAAGARVSTPAYATRRIAELTGLSQTLVSRAVRRIRTPDATASDTGDDQASTPAAESQLRLAEFRVEYPRLSLSFEATDHAAEKPRPRVFERRAAALMAALRVCGAAEWIPVSPTAHTRSSSTDTPARVTQRGETAGTRPDLPHVSPHRWTVHWQPQHGDWAEFLCEVSTMLDRCRPTLEAVPAQLLDQLASRAGRGLHGLAWTRRSQPRTGESFSDSKTLSLAEYPAPVRKAADRSQSVRALSATEQIAIVLRKEMISSGFRAGDRLSAGLLAQRLGLSPTRVRNAMRQLADDGLLTHQQGGFRIPHLSGTDVIDLYASRLHVGMVILRACATQPRHRLLPARLALGTLEAVAKQGSRADAGEADLRFQQELADGSGLQQSAHSFHALTLRLRMFISVLQLDYSPAVDRLVADDRRLLAAILEGRAEDAVRIWRSKLDDAVRHMSALAPDTFDPRLWSQLTA